MPAKLESIYIFNKNIEEYSNKILSFLEDFRRKIEKKLKQNINFDTKLKDNKININISFETGYPHTILFQLRNQILQNFGRSFSLTVKNIIVKNYELEFKLDKKPLKDVKIPFVDKLNIQNNKCFIKFNEITDHNFIRKNYVNRIVKRIKEKIEQQYYEGKAEYSEILWSSEQKVMVWKKDPSKEMEKLGWIQRARTKGKWIFGPQLAKIIRVMRKLVFNEIIEPMGFREIIEPHHEAFSTLLKTGHLEGVPMEVYYVCEPKTRTPEEWETFIDKLKITLEVPYDELMKLIEFPNAINCYVQCPNIYEFFSGKTIADNEFPILVYDATAVSNRYESGGRHGIERMDEFHRIELVYIGTKEQLLKIREQLIDKYKYIFNEILDLEWRMAWVTPFYMQQSGLLELDDKVEKIKGTIDFEAYLPYRGSREESEWLEFQNLSIVGDKYIKAFNIKSQKLDLWSGCSGIGLERWTVSFLAQKGLDPKNWPDKFRELVGDLPKGFKFY